MKFKEKPLLAWMQPGSSKRQQILSVALVPLQPGIPFPLSMQVMDQQPAKLAMLLRKAREEEPAARQDLVNRMESLGLLPWEAQDETLTDNQLAAMIASDSELQMYLRVDDQGKDEPEEIPGARELYQNLTMYQWLEALEAEVEGRSDS